MYNWSVNTTRLKKNKKAYCLWKLEQLINYGLGKEKLHEEKLKKYFPFLHIDKNKKAFFKFLLWPQKS